MAARYVYRCSAGHRFESYAHGATQCPEHFNTELTRDYRAEGVTPNTAALARERGGQDIEWFKQNFLPTADEFAGPGDPDGSKGLTKWNDEHGPKDSNKAPARPTVPKRVF
jgi:hypothetical protein